MSDTIISQIFDCMMEDGENKEKQSEILQSYFDAATEAEKKVVNNIMICVCGYSLETIIYHPENITS